MGRPPSIHLTGSRLRRSRARNVAAAATIALGLIGITAFARPSPVLVWNASSSAPIGLYRLVRERPALGDLVLVRAPDDVAPLAARRGYLPPGVPLVKRIVAMPGEFVCALNQAIIIGGEIVARRFSTDTQGRALPWWNECRDLSADELFLLNGEAQRSFDSRYFGPVPAKNIIGRLVPLWTE